MDLANMRRQGVHHLVAFCLHDACRAVSGGLLATAQPD
jgi:hypothetical protein